MLFSRDLLDRDRAAVGDVGGVDRLVADELPAGDRVQAVGGDDEPRLVHRAVGEPDAGAACPCSACGRVSYPVTCWPVRRSTPAFWQALRNRPCRSERWMTM